MTRSKKLLSLLLALMIVSAGAFAAYKFIPDESEDDTTEDTGENITLLSFESSEATGLSWAYEGEVLSFSNNGNGWVYTEDEDFPLDGEYIADMLSVLSDLTATKSIEQPEDITQYGLDEPYCTVSVTAEDTVQLTFGDETSMGGERYLSTGDGNVYLVDESIADEFQYGLYDVVSKENIPSMDEMECFELSCDTQDMKLVFMENSGLAYSDEYKWFSETEGSYITLDTELTEDFITDITELSWEQCVNYKADSEALSGYGLGDPSAMVNVSYIETVEVETNEKDEDGDPIYDTHVSSKVFCLEIGGYYDSSYCYARLAGSEMIYLINADILDSLLYTGVNELLPDEVILMDWNTIETVEINIDDQTYMITKSVKEVENEDGEKTEEPVWLWGEIEIDIESLYDSLDRIESTGSSSGLSPDRRELIGFVFYRPGESYEKVELVFYEYDSENCLVSLNGECRLFAERTQITKITEAVKALFE